MIGVYFKGKPVAFLIRKKNAADGGKTGVALPFIERDVYRVLPGYAEGADKPCDFAVVFTVLPLVKGPAVSWEKEEGNSDYG